MAFATLYAYQNNPRARVAQVVAKYEGLDLEWVETNPFAENQSGFPAGYLEKYPQGLVPALEKGDLQLTEAVAIANYLAGYENKAGLLGSDKDTAAKVQQWALWANFTLLPSIGAWFAPLIGRAPYNKGTVDAAKTKMLKNAALLEKALATRTYLAGERLSVADIFVASAITRGFDYVLDAEFRKKHVNLMRHYNTVIHQDAFFSVLGGEPKMVDETVKYTPPKKEEKPKAAAPPKAAKAPKAKEVDEEEEPAVVEAPKAKHPCEALGPAKSFPLDEFKRQYSNNETVDAIKWLEANYDPQEYSLWKAEYKYPEELTQVFMSSNLVTGFHSRLEGSRKYVFGSTGVYGENNNNKIVGVYMIRGSDYKGVFDVAPDYESYNFTPLDFKADREFIEGCWSWTNEVDGLKYADGKVMK